MSKVNISKIIEGVGTCSENLIGISENLISISEKVSVISKVIVEIISEFQTETDKPVIETKAKKSAPKQSEAKAEPVKEKVKEYSFTEVTIKEYALQQALSGTHYDGFKVVEGRANRKYTDDDAVAFATKDAGFDPYEKKLLDITAMTTLMGKKKFEEVLGKYITKPQGKPALVPESDKRPAINTAYEDFSEN